MRHSSRYGLTSLIRADNGSNLVSLQSAQFETQDLNLALSHKAGIHIEVSSAKSHESNGHIGRIHDIHKHLSSLLVQSLHPVTPLQWQTAFSTIAAQLNNIPLAAGDLTKSPTHPFNVLTPNLLLTGRNHHRDAHYTAMIDARLPSLLLERNEAIIASFMKKFAKLVMHLNARTSKWLAGSTLACAPSVGDIIFSIKLDDNARTTWALSRIVNISNNGHRLKLETSRPGGGFSKLIRSPRECAIVIKENSPPFNPQTITILYIAHVARIFLLVVLPPFSSLLQSEPQTTSSRMDSERPQTLSRGERNP